jgi:hypothetical protein
MVAMQRISEILKEQPVSLDERAIEEIEEERREQFWRTSAEWAGPEDDGDESKPQFVQCRTCPELMRPLDAFVKSGGEIYCGACRKQKDDIANGIY